MTTTLARPDGARIAWDDTGAAGDGAPVVFLHGFPLHRGMWRAQLASLRDVRRCIAPDYRGFGESGAGSTRLSVDVIADDVAALLDHLRVERAVIAGLSMGGYVAFALLRRHAARVAALVLAHTRAAADDDAARAKRADLIALARDEGSAGVAVRQSTGLVGKTTRETRPDLVEATRAMLAQASVAAIVAGTEALRDRPDATAQLASIAVPTLVVCGDEDAVTPAKEMRAMAVAVPGARVVTLERCGHLGNLEQPSRFDEALRAFLR